MGDGLSVTTDSKTGRSHRMIAEALQRVRNGKTVTVIALYHRGEQRLQDIALELGASPSEVIKLCIVKCKGIWDLENLLARNAEDFEYFVDHAVIENNFANVLAMLRRYDAK